jgi:hypothetical protein
MKRIPSLLAVLVAIAAVAAPAAAQPRIEPQPVFKQLRRDAEQRPAEADVPPAHRPPPGMCRVWLNGVPAAQQPAATDCATAIRNRPENGRVLFGDDYVEKDRRGRDAKERRPPAQPRSPSPPDSGGPDARYTSVPGVVVSEVIPVLVAALVVVERAPEDLAGTGARGARLAQQSPRGQDRRADDRARARDRTQARERAARERAARERRQAEERRAERRADRAEDEDDEYDDEDEIDDDRRRRAGEVRDGSGRRGRGDRVVVVPGGADPRYYDDRYPPPGRANGTCLDRDRDGWCDDPRYGPPVCLDRDGDGRCDDYAALAAAPYASQFPPMRAGADVRTGFGSGAALRWLGTAEVIARTTDLDRDGIPERIQWLDANNGQLLQVWSDRDRDGVADRVEVYRNGRRVKLFGR